MVETNALYVVCRETITSPAPDRPDLFRPNEPCGLRCKVVRPAPVMELRCSRGHVFVASENEIKRDRSLMEDTPE